MLLHQELVPLCSKGGFCLTKWMSNKSGVLETIPASLRAKGMGLWDMELGALPVERVLGVVNPIYLSSRSNLRTDHLPEEEYYPPSPQPLGMLSPVILTAKKILRDLCRRRVGWDETIPESVAQDWMKVIQQLHLLDKFEVSMCLKPPQFGEACTAQLHHFIHASENGYGTVTYLVSKNKNSELHCAFVIGKS